MRHSNYIYDHSMILPDIADFPECIGEKFPETVDISNILKEFEASFSELNINKFNTTLNKLVAVIDANIKLSSKAYHLRIEQLKRISQFTKIFMSSTATQRKRDDIASSTQYEDLYENGIHSTTIDTTELYRMVQEDCKELLNKIVSIPDPHNYDRAINYTAKNHPKLIAGLNRIYKEKGLLSAASKYNQGKDLQIQLAALHIASPSDMHHYQTLLDCKTTTKLISLHNDPKHNLMKSILYLNDVDEDTGPFSYIPQSNRWWYNEVEKLFAYGNSTGNYLDSPAARELALSFPATFRKTVIVGRFIPDNTELSNILLSSIVKYTSDKANCMLFDPLGFHRGGLCTTKQRINFQILIR